MLYAVLDGGEGRWVGLAVDRVHPLPLGFHETRRHVAENRGGDASLLSPLPQARRGVSGHPRTVRAQSRRVIQRVREGFEGRGHAGLGLALEGQSALPAVARGLHLRRAVREAADLALAAPG